LEMERRENSATVLNSTGGRFAFSAEDANRTSTSWSRPGAAKTFTELSEI